MKRRLFFLSSCLAACLATFAQVRLPRLVRDSMILQRGRPIPIWGWAGKGERVSVEFDGKTYRSRSGQDGKWMLELPAMKAGGPYTMVVSGKNKIVLRDVLVGDVWLCSGQSNMVHQLRLHSVRYPEAIADAHYPEIRQFWIPTLTDLGGPQDDLPAGHWMSAVPQDVAEFSAVAYFFARDLYEKYHVPIGIINASVGGTPIEAWISEEGLKDFPDLVKTIEKNKDTAYINDMARRRWAEMAHMPKPVDKGLTGAEPWYSPAYVPKGWRQIGVPGYWEDQGLRDLDGVVWYRREIDVPPSMTGKPAKVFLGRIVNADALYINGKEVGNTTYEYPQRRYTVPADVLKPGKNLFVVRVTNTFGKGGFVPDKPYCLFAGGDTIDLKGYWEYKVGEVFVPHPRSGGWAFSAQNAPSALYNAMIAPLIPYGIKGFVWYQGEANANHAAEYARLQPAMIADWRSHWKEGDIPFLYVQLPGFGDYNYLPAESGWAELREAQLQTLAVPHTGMAVAIDLGEWNDIHPDRKEPVGDRLALAAEAIAYGDSGVVYSGPIYKSAVLSGGRVTLSFTHVGRGLITNDGEEPQEFALAGADKKFVWARAAIDGDKVVVWNDTLKDPKFVRYAWADDPVDPNLYNKEGLPASPFEGVVSPGLADIDHDHMMRLLGITSLRPGPSGDEHAPNHANYDEAKANPCPLLPDILTLNDGTKVTTADMWWKQRRPEIVDGLEREVYGRVPADVPGVTWSVKDSEAVSVGGVPVVAKELVGHVDNSGFPSIGVDIKMVVVLPVNVKGPVPVLMCFGRASLPAAPGASTASGAPAASAVNPFVKQMMEREQEKEQELLAAGWGYVAIDPTSIQADNGPGLTQGIIGLVNRGQPRKPEDWGALRAWAWGAARGLDYLETDPLVDAGKVGIEGVSRYGKAALVTLAFEPRFAMGLIGSSGKGGATLLRRNYGEAVESLTGGEYYWMAGNFLRYGAAEASFGSKTGCDLDVDSHDLIALCAPRLTFISYGIPAKGDAHWLDHEGSYMATVAAGAVFKLLGAKDLGVSNDYMREKMPPVNTGLLDGQLAWRQHDGGHTDGPNVSYFISWASRLLGYTASAAGTASADAAKGLKDYYAAYFPIGVSVTPKNLSGDEARLILQQFNSLTPENAMKMGPIHPQENVYHWDDADSIVAFAQRHHLRVRGHNLCWHNQAPGWMFKDANGNQVSKEALLQRLKDHILSVVGRYKGKIYAWDVVNEAVADDSAHYLRPSLWYQICGDEYIEKAFEYAHAADPSAVLFYNDYNTENPVKREKIYRLLKGLLAKGVPVGGIGLQGHWSVNAPTREELERSIQLFSSLGLQVQITELDISVYPGHQGGQMVTNNGGNVADSGFTAAMEQKQLEQYKMVFDVFRKYKDKITGVTFWNVSDRHSWLDNRGRKNYPLLFDKDLQPKKAYRAVVDF